MKALLKCLFSLIEFCSHYISKIALDEFFSCFSIGFICPSFPIDFKIDTGIHFCMVTRINMSWAGENAATLYFRNSAKFRSVLRTFRTNHFEIRIFDISKTIDSNEVNFASVLSLFQLAFVDSIICFC